MKFIAINTCQGDKHKSAQTIRAVLLLYSPSTSRAARMTLMPARTGFTSQATPNRDPRASMAGQPGGVGEYQRSDSEVKRAMSDAARTGRAGMASRPFGKYRA